MDTPEPVQNARESSIKVGADVDPDLSHVRFTENVACGGDALFEAGDEAEVQELDYYKDRGWLLTVRDDDGWMRDFHVDEHGFEWVYGS